MKRRVVYYNTPHMAMAHQAVSSISDVHVQERRSKPSSPKTHKHKTDKNVVVVVVVVVDDQQSDITNIVSSSSSLPLPLPCKQGTATTRSGDSSNEENTRERLKRHRVEMAGRVWIPDIWGQEDFLKDWIDCSAFDACLGPNGLMSARASLIQEGRRATSGGLRIEKRERCVCRPEQISVT